MIQRKNVIGEKYNMLTIIGDAPSRRQPNGDLLKMVNVKCDCGNTKDNMPYREIKRSKVKSCGCLNGGESKLKVNPGDVFTHWTVLEESDGYFRNGEKSGRTFLCRCVCGKEKDVNLQSLNKGISKSCGCRGILREEKIKKEKIIPQNTETEQWKESVSYPGYYISTLGRLFSYKTQIIHDLKRSYKISANGKRKEFVAINEMYLTFIGEYDKELYRVNLKEGEVNIKNLELLPILCKMSGYNVLQSKYSNMFVRCNNKNSKSYSNYGGKGIKIEESFDTFEKFYNWSIEQGFEEGKGLEIDRIDGTKGYSAENCRYVSREENILNTSYFDYMTTEDVKFIRLGKISRLEVLKKYKVSESTLDNILEYRTLKNI